MGDYATATTRAQVARLRPAAVEALRAYQIDVVSVRLLKHAYNTSFRVDTADGRRYSLRLGTARRKPDDQVTGELAWLDALARDTELVVPAPVRTVDGALLTDVWSEPLARPLSAVLMTWLPGRDLDTPTSQACRALGRTSAELHRHARSWRLPDGAGFPRMDEVLLDAPHRLIEDHPLLTPERRAIVDDATSLAAEAYREVAAIDTFHPVHADLHGGNLKWLRGTLAVFDFDDAMMGSAVHDLAIAAYYLRDDPVLESALFEGYADLGTVPDHPAGCLEALVAGRNLLLLHEVLTSSTAEIRDIAPRYVANTTAKLQAFLRTGSYRHAVDGVESIP